MQITKAKAHHASAKAEGLAFPGFFLSLLSRRVVSLLLLKNTYIFKPRTSVNKGQRWVNLQCLLKGALTYTAIDRCILKTPYKLLHKMFTE